jgi:Peptidase C10 family/Spi protease inhibitor/Secretion system C-terminal sorting domain/SprB repeat
LFIEKRMFMKRKVLLLIVAFFALKFNISAATVTLQDAQRVALNFFNVTTGNNQTRLPLTATLQYTRTETDNVVDFYVFNISPVKGFVIVSATDNDDPIIGYSTESSFPNDFSKIGLNEWLGRWAEELHFVSLNNVVASPYAATRWAAYRQGFAPPVLKSGTVGPLCQTTWDQSNPTSSTPVLYNTYCPGTGSNQAVTGCVATTMAQIMRYWKYPAQGSGGNVCYTDNTNNGYSNNYGQLCFNFTSYSFDWANMPLGLTNSSSSAQITAVGKLMYAAGVTVNMDYGASGSGAFVQTSEAGGGACAQLAYVQNFGYDANTIAGHFQSNYSTNNWINLIEGDLNAGRLVQYEGADVSQGGHTWVCDGYDANNNLHMNWGWSGAGDGYYAVNNLSPAQNGQSLGLDFTQQLGALIGIQPPPANMVETASVSNSSICPGGSTTLTAKTHTNATYSWSPTTGLSCPSCAVTNVTATATTVYTVTADSAGVTASASITVNVNAPIIPGAGSATNVSCNGLANGSASITATGGTGSYTYAWSNSQTTATISNLAPGTYKVTITDTKGCTATASQTISQPNALSGSITPTNASCGSSNGSASVAVTGGTSSYTYHWNSGQTVATISNLAAGNYTVTITDAHSCTATATTTIASTGGFTPTLTPTNVGCKGAATGSITASVTGVSGLTYTWSNNATTATISNLAAGTYTVTISNGSGCSATASQTVTQPSTAVSATVTPVNATCNLANGSVSASGTGGTGAYTYLWSTSATTASISGLGAGTYEVTVKDANACAYTASVTLTSSAGLNTNAVATSPSCYGGSNGSIGLTVTGNAGALTYSWSNGTHSATLSNVAAGNYSVTVSDASGCSASLSESVTQPAAITLTLTPAGAACGSPNGSVTAAVTGGTSGYSYTWSNSAGNVSSISNLSAGNYSVTVTDSKGCTAVATATVANSGSLSLTPAFVSATCNGQNTGQASVNVGNGTGPFNYSWSNGAKTSTISNLPAGLYNVTVSDNNGCSSTASVNVTQPAAIVVTTATTDCSAGANNGSATISNVSGGTGSYTYYWSNGDSSQTITNLPAGTYEVSVTDANGCQTQASAVVSVTTGISAVNNNITFTMYPNPASSDVVISLGNLNTETTLSLKNILGQQIVFQPLTAIQTHIDVSNLANGVYLIEIRQAGKEAVKQLIVNK